MLRHLIAVVPLVSAAAALSGCGSVNMSEMNFFPDKAHFFKAQDWGSGNTTAPDMLPTGPVSAEDQIDAAGHCVAQATATTSTAAVGTVAGDLGTTGTAAPQTDAAVAPGGISLGMTECQVVAHAGQPGQVSIAADENNARKVVLTYQSGPWPGIYTFNAGRLKVIDRVAQPEPPKGKSKGARRASAAQR